MTDEPTTITPETLLPKIRYHETRKVAGGGTLGYVWLRLTYQGTTGVVSNGLFRRQIRLTPKTTFTELRAFLQDAAEVIDQTVKGKTLNDIEIQSYIG